MPAEQPGFFRANAGGLSVVAGISAISGVATAITRLGEKVAVQSVTDPKTDPFSALRSVRYLRQRFDANHRGLWYAISNSPRYKDAQKEEAAGHKWLDQAEEYWQRRLLPVRTGITQSLRNAIESSTKESSSMADLFLARDVDGRMLLDSEKVRKCLAQLPGVGNWRSDEWSPWICDYDFAEDLAIIEWQAGYGATIDGRGDAALQVAIEIQ